MPAVLASLRISRLRENENLEDALSAVLKHLGDLKRLYLTAFEEELLSFLFISEHIPCLNWGMNLRWEYSVTSIRE
jgi:hypothetical protein